MKKNTYKAIVYAETKAQALIDAAGGKDSTCAVFNNPFNGEWTEEQRRAIRLYVESWILEPLSLALDSIDGDRSFSTDSALESFARDRAGIRKVRASS